MVPGSAYSLVGEQRKEDMKTLESYMGRGLCSLKKGRVPLREGE